MRRHWLPDAGGWPGIAATAFAPAGRIDGLPAGLPDAEGVLSREDALAWHPVPDAPWRIEHREDALLLVPA